MAIKTLTGTYASGYTLSAGYSGLTIAASAKVSGVAGAAGQSSTITNGGAGGLGGVGILASGSVSVASKGGATGGQGGAGGGGEYQGGIGGAGGVGLDLASGGSVTITGGAIAGGVGGTGGAAAKYPLAGRSYGGAGGTGGVGIYLAGSGSVTMEGGAVVGGAGGVGGSGTGAHNIGGRGGQGGAGLSLDGSGAFTLIAGTVVGGRGGASGAFRQGGGYGGEGVDLAGGGTFTNLSTVTGGAAYYATEKQGDGVVASGILINGGKTDPTATISGWDGVATAGQTTIENYGTISGSESGINCKETTNLINGSVTDSTALIYGGDFGIIAGASGDNPNAEVTVTNFGTIATRSGQYTVAWGAISGVRGGKRLIAEAGSKFVDGWAVGDAYAGFELAGGSGTISGLGGLALISGAVSAAIKSFGQYYIDAGGSWTIQGPTYLGFQSLTIAGATTWNNKAGSRVLLMGDVSIAATGSIDSAGMSAMVLEARRSIVNDGVIAATGAGVIVLGSTLINSGDAVISAGPGSKVVFEGSDVIGGTFSSTGTGLIEFAVSTRIVGFALTLDGATSAVTNKGRMVLFNAVTLNAVGAIAGSGQIVFAGSTKLTSVVIAAGGVTLSGGGVVNLGNSNQNLITGASGAASLVNVSDKIEGGGRLGGGQLTLVNQAGGIIEGTGAIGLTIDTGAATIINAGLIWAAGHAVTVDSAIANNGKLYAMRGVLTLVGPVTGAGTAYINGGTLIAKAAFSQTVIFNGQSGVLELGQSQAYAGQIVGFSTSGKTTLDLGDIGFTGAGEASFSGAANRGVLTVSDGTHTAHITLVGNFLASTFVAASDGHGGVSVTASATQVFAAAMASTGTSSAASGAARASEPDIAQPMLARPGGA